MKLKGIGASSGVAIAEVYLVKENHVEVKKKIIEDIKKEKNCIKEAISKTVNDIKITKNKAIEKLAKKELAIFDAHIQFAQDPSLIQEINNLIDVEKCDAVFATKKITDNFYNMFFNMEDAYMKERAADIKDVANRIINHLTNNKEKNLSKINQEVIIVANDLSPSQTALLDKKYVKGFVTDIGGRTSHAAIMARSLEIPAILGLKNISYKVQDGDLIAINGDKGEVIINPNKEEIIYFESQIQEFQKTFLENEKYRNKKTQTRDGKHLELVANIASPKDIPNVLKNNADGVGLFRSEFLYMDSSDWPTEEEQFIAYKKVLKEMKNKKVVIRTLDIGGDKKLDYYNFPKELNPFLGYRAIRFCLDNKDIFRTQIRALLRASIFGKLAIMLPMITTINEFITAKQIVKDCHQELEEEGVEISNNYEIGMMVEIPAVAILAKKFAKYADFFSIGTNDLMQYTMAADRMNEKISYLYQPLNPSIINMINLIIKGAHSHNKWVGMCGELASDKNIIPILIGLGLDEFSMSPSLILGVKRQIANIDYHAAKKLANYALECSTEEEVKKLIKKFFEEEFSKWIQNFIK